jgi:hypothetical protein
METKNKKEAGLQNASIVKTDIQTFWSGKKNESIFEPTLRDKECAEILENGMEPVYVPTLRPYNAKEHDTWVDVVTEREWVFLKGSWIMFDPITKYADWKKYLESEIASRDAALLEFIESKKKGNYGNDDRETQDIYYGMNQALDLVASHIKQHG